MQQYQGGNSLGSNPATSAMGASMNSNGGNHPPQPGEICPADLPEHDGKTQLIVNYVSHQVSDEEFKAVFAQFGDLDESRIIRDKHSMRSKGFGFVYYKDAKSAAAAVRALNGFELYEKWIKIGFADPQRPYVSPSTSATSSHACSSTAINAATAGMHALPQVKVSSKLPKNTDDDDE